MAMINANGIRMHYQLIPAKNPRSATPPTVVFVHGLGYDSLASFYLTLASPVSEAGITAFTYDLRAHGRSERPPTGYLMDHFVEDLRELLDNTGVQGPVHLVGNSFGGTIAFSFADRYPERVSSIVSIESEPATEEWAGKMGTTMTNVVKELHEEENMRWVEETWGHHIARLTRAAGVMLDATTIMQEVHQGPLLGDAELRNLTCPVLSIVGDQGFQMDNPTKLQDWLPNCRIEIVEDQNHSVLVERHRLVRELLLAWVAEHDTLPSAEPAYESVEPAYEEAGAA
jgi:pimeloyl-ACP methyl ester carboxylesterase